MRWKWIPGPLTVRMAACWLASVAIGWISPAIGRADTPAEDALKPMVAIDAGGHTGWITKILLNGYHDQLISVCRDKTIRFWDVKTGEPLRVLRPPIDVGLPGKIYTAALSPDGQLLAVAGQSALLPPGDERVLLISLPGGDMLRTLQGHTLPIRGLKFSPDGRRLVSGSDDNTARVWDVATGLSLMVYREHGRRVYCVDWSPDGKHIVSGSFDKTARIWSPDGGATSAVLTGHTQDVSGVAWSPDGRTVATTGDKSVRLWEPDGRFRYGWYDLESHGQFVAFSDDSRQLLYSWGDRNTGKHGTAIFDAIDGHHRSRFYRHVTTPMDGLFLPGGGVAVTVGPPGDIWMWKTSDGSLVRRLCGKGRLITNVGWSPDGHAIGWGGATPESTKIDGKAPLDRSFCLQNLDFGPSPDASYLRAATVSGDLTLRRVQERVLTARRGGFEVSRMIFPYENDKIRSWTFVPGNRVVLGCSYGLFLYDALSGRLIYSLPGHTDTVWALATSPSGRYVLSGGGDETLEIWSTDPYELLVSLFFAGDEWIAWTPSGYYAASLAGESLMGWHVNRGPDQMADFYPAVHFRASLYRPDVIRRLIAVGNSRQALAEADDQRAKASRTVVLSASLPPIVNLHLPADPAADGKVQINVAANPQGEPPVEKLRLLVDGRPFDERQYHSESYPGQPAPEVLETFTVTLPPGKHELAVKADTSVSYGLSEPVDVGQDPSPATKPRLFVLAIGVNDGSTDKTGRQWAVNDVRALAEKLQSNGKQIFREILTYELKDAEVTRESLLGGFQWLKRYMQTDDVGVVIFVGRIGTDSNGAARLMASGGITGMSQREIEQVVQSTRGKLHLWLDTRTDTRQAEQLRERVQAGRDYCLDPPAGQPQLPDFGLANEMLRELSSPDYGVRVLGAARSRETAEELTADQHGAFARALLDGLSGKADFNSDGVVEMSELEAYLTSRVDELTAGRQHPVSRQPAMAPNVPLAKPPTMP